MLSDYEKIARHFSQSLKNLCREQDLSLSRLSEMTGISKSALSAAMNGHSMPNLLTLIHICEAMHVSPDMLLGIGGSTGDTVEMMLSEKERDLIWLYRSLPDGKKRWLEESMEMLRPYLPETQW